MKRMLTIHRIFAERLGGSAIVITRDGEMSLKNTYDTTSKPPENLKVFGRCLSMVYRPVASPGFDDLIAELDRADRATPLQREKSQTSA